MAWKNLKPAFCLLDKYKEPPPAGVFKKIP